MDPTIANAILVALLLLTVPLIGYSVGRERATRDSLEDERAYSAALSTQLAGAQAREREATERLIRQVIDMRRDGFTTIPEDEHFGSYAFTPEQEAQLEQERAGHLHHG